MGQIRKVKRLQDEKNLTNLLLGGCTAFGHSCFGGHGKRSEQNQPEDISKERSISRNVPDYVFSRSNDEIFTMDPSRRIQDKAERRISEIDKHQLKDDPLSIFIRQWVIIDKLSII